MAGGFSAQISQMLGASDLAADAARDLQQEVDRLRAKWDDLAGTWKGLAASAYAPEWEQWIAGAEKTISALDSESVLLAQHAYSFEQNDSGSGGAIDSSVPG